MALFAQLWSNHPALQTPPIDNPCFTNGVANHENQCAIRLGVALSSSGVSLASYKGAFCWNNHGRSHPLRAEQLRDWLNSDDAWFIPEYATIYRRDAQGRQRSSQFFTGRQGIVAFINFWGPGNRGDHIDLWNGSRIARGEPNYFERSQEIWFWDLV